MATATKNKTKASKASDPNALQVKADNDTSRERAIAELGLSPIMSNVATTMKFAKGYWGDLNINDARDVMLEKVERTLAGNLNEVETTLTVQAVTLDAIFNELARRASFNMGEHLNATEIYLRLALKAQGQCRATLETLAEIKYPKAPTFVRQQNVAYQQQVNNGDATSKNNASSTPAPAHGKTSNQSNELLEAQHGEWLDSGTAAKASSNDSQLEAVGAVNGADDRGR
jgi:hypothetical protein